MTIRAAAGCMTGTSLDSIDVALVEIRGRALDMEVRFIRGFTRPLADLGRSLRRVAEQEPLPASAIAALARDFSLAHAEAVAGLGLTSPPSFIAVHGQTVFHSPPASWQLFNPWPLVRAARAPVVFDFRGADLAAGGRGAPITPVADFVLFRDRAASRAIVNLGGFCNVTILPASAEHDAPATPEVTGQDVCACNHVLDALARRLLDRPYDDHGRTALSGRVVPEIATRLADLLVQQSRSGRSLGTGDEFAAHLDTIAGTAAVPDVLRSACDAIARAVALAVRSADEVALAGGGTRNAALTCAISDHLGRAAPAVDDLGVPAEYREAACMAVLGALCQDRVPITLARVTGVPVPAPLAGCWAYP